MVATTSALQTLTFTFYEVSVHFLITFNILRTEDWRVVFC